MLADGADFLESALGILKAGLCLVPIATFLPEEEKDFVIKAAGVHWLLQEDHRLFRLPFANPVDDRNDEEFRACDPAYIRFTSGTTGLRKGILLGHQTILDRLDAANAILQINSDDRIWFALPMADHFIASILLYLSRGATVLTASTSANRRQIAHDYRPTMHLRFAGLLPGSDPIRYRSARFRAACHLHYCASSGAGSRGFCQTLQQES